MSTINPWPNRIKLILLALLFIVPILVAHTLLQMGWTTGHSGNYGELVEPTVDVEDLRLVRDGEEATAGEFRGVWTMLIGITDECDQACYEVLDQSGRVHVALNHNMDRVRRALVVTPSVRLPDELAGFPIYEASETTLADWNGGGPISVQLVDPEGRHMMAYGYPLDAHGMLKDFERLLRLSRRAVERYRAMIDDELP